MNGPATNRGVVTVMGGCGFIGSHLARALVRENYPVRIFDKVYADHSLISDFEDNVEVLEGDVARADDVLAAIESADTVINLIHTTVPGSSMLDPAYDVETNVVSSVRWLSSLSKTKVRKLIFISSGGTVYGLPRTNLINEQHPTDPINSYGITKLMIEKYVGMYAPLNRIEHVILRPSNVYGEGQRLHIGQGVIGVLAYRALRREPLEIWGSGKDLRDYLYIDDFVGAVLSLLDYSGAHRVFNVSSGRGHSVLEILAILQSQLGDMPAVVHTEARGFDVPVNVLDSTLLRQATGWQARMPLADGVRRVVQWLKDEADLGGGQ